MYLSKIRVIDYKSFRDSGEIEFKQGINLIVGQNNSGKTTLLEALEIKIKDIPHRSLKTEKNKVYSINETNHSTLFISLKLIKNDFPKSINIMDNALFWIPLPETILDKILPDKLTTIGDSERIRKRNRNQSEFLDYFNQRFNENSSIGMTINFKFTNLNPVRNFNLGFYDSDFNTKNKFIVLSWKEKYSKFVINESQSNLPNNDVGNFGWEKITHFTSKVYRFDAERTDLSGCYVGYSKELNSNASNLAEVIQNIKNDNPDIYDEFNKYVSEVLPSVKWVTSVKAENNKSGGGNWHEVRIWSVNKKTRRNDLAFPLAACGTGIGQVLAILFVIIASEEPRTIIIDEPNSFLHPSAAQKLIQILSKPEFSHHQYFISTHSPEIVTAAKPSTITMLRYEEGETKIEQIDLSNNDGIKKVFKDLGIEPATFAFANHILWVEGQTEEKAFPLIFDNADIQTVIVKPTVPSNFRQNKKRFENVRHIFNLHKTVSGTDSVISPKMTVLLDKEIGKEAENQDLIKEFGEEINFIPRAMFENYLLNAEAIEYILNFTKSTENYTDVDGAKLLDNLFKDFLGKPFGYERYKVEYGEKLTQWLLDNKPEHLAELRDFLINLVADKESS